MKKFIKNLLAVALVGAMLGSFGCKDYDEDIKSLNDRVDKVEASVADLQAKIDAGAVITGVTNNGDGVVVTLSNGQSFTLKHGTNGKDGQPGKDGEDGKDADVWTIGDDGFWYKNGTKTEYKALGIKGDKGDKGDDGKYYFPGEDGLWDIYENGQKVEDTNISWVGKGLTAVYSNGTVTLSGVEGAEGTVTIKSGAQLGSVAFVPNKVVIGLGYPTTDEPWLVLPAYLDDSRTDNDWKQPWDKSNVVKTVYRLNPTDAYVGGAKYAFINRYIQVARGVEGDQVTLLNEEGVALKDAGQVDVNATFNYTAYNGRADVNFAALQVWAGQNPVTSDYIATFYEDVYPCIIHPAHDEVPAHHNYYQRTASLKAGEDHGFLIDFVGEVGDAQYPAHFYYSYNDENALDLMPEVLLYECDRDKSFADLGFTGISYKFSLPEEYLADDPDLGTRRTNQQDFINVTEDGKVTINKNGAWVNENGSLEPAEGRTPVVRVDAYMTPNKKNGKVGEAQVVASAYIKIEITAKAMPVGPQDRIPANYVTFDDQDAPSFDYRRFSNVYDDYNDLYVTNLSAWKVAAIEWERFNKLVYGAEKLNAVNFWDYYGGDDDHVEVSIKAGDNVICSKAVLVGQRNVVTTDGITAIVELNKVGTETTDIAVYVDENVKTQHTHGGNAAVYTVEITIPSENTFKRGDYVLTQTFKVFDSCPKYRYNEAYDHENNILIDSKLNEDVANAAKATGLSYAFIVKGHIVNNDWVVRAGAYEAFEIINEEDIFAYYADNVRAAGEKEAYVTMVDAIEFTWATPTFFWEGTNVSTGYSDMVEPAANAVMTSNFWAQMMKPMTQQFYVKSMNLTQTLKNGEKCGQTYNYVFYNPFKAAADETPVKIYGNTPGVQTVQVAQNGFVKDIYEEKVIATWNATTKSFDVAENIYGVDAGEVVYTNFAWDVNDAQYKQFALDHKDELIKLTLNASTGEVQWDNSGDELDTSYKLPIIATIAIKRTDSGQEDLTYSNCTMYVELLREKK